MLNDLPHLPQVLFYLHHRRIPAYAAGFLLLPWLTRFLTPEQFGINALYISTMYLIQIIASFGLDMAIGALYFDHKDGKEQMRSPLRTLFIGLLIIKVFTFFFFALGGFRLFTTMFRSGDSAGHGRGMITIAPPFSTRQDLFDPADLPAAPRKVLLAEHFQLRTHRCRHPLHPLPLSVHALRTDRRKAGPGHRLGHRRRHRAGRGVRAGMGFVVCEKIFRVSYPIPIYGVDVGDQLHRPVHHHGDPGRSDHRRDLRHRHKAGAVPRPHHGRADQHGQPESVLNLERRQHSAEAPRSEPLLQRADRLLHAGDPRLCPPRSDHHPGHYQQ
ncbi:MAG: oligosaccharide flippase family protein [Marinilabiliales bacterium]|nr:oligosaccharide flippase family protein [Marinilabiliales bacterium]